MLSGIVKKSGDILWKFEQICRDRNVKKLEELIQSGWNVNTKVNLVCLCVYDQFIDLTIATTPPPDPV